MDKIRLFVFLSVLGGLIYLGFIYYSDQSVIDDDYVASESYQQLEERLEKEQERSFSEEESLRMIFEQMLKSNHSKELELPITDTFLSLVEAESHWQELQGFKFKDLGKINRSEITLSFVLIQKPHVYDEAGLVMATSQNDSLIQLQTIGQFKNTVTEKVETQVQIGETNVIATKVFKKILYPVEQENSTTYLYQISESGRIKLLEE